MMPPLCFTIENARTLVQSLDNVLAEAEQLGLDGLGEADENPEENYFKTGYSDDEDETNEAYADMD